MNPYQKKLGSTASFLISLISVVAAILATLVLVAFPAISLLAWVIDAPTRFQEAGLLFVLVYAIAIAAYFWYRNKKSDSN